MESLESRGQMTLIGRAKIDGAMADGSWSLLDGIKRLEKPAALVEARRPTRRRLRTGSPSRRRAKKGAVRIIASAKIDATRQGRIAECVRLASMNKRLGQPGMRG